MHFIGKTVHKWILSSEMREDQNYLKRVSLTQNLPDALQISLLEREQKEQHLLILHPSWKSFPLTLCLVCTRPLSSLAWCFDNKSSRCPESHIHPSSHLSTIALHLYHTDFVPQFIWSSLSHSWCLNNISAHSVVSRHAAERSRFLLSSTSLIHCSSLSSVWLVFFSPSDSEAKTQWGPFGNLFIFSDSHQNQYFDSIIQPS